MMMMMMMMMMPHLGGGQLVFAINFTPGVPVVWERVIEWSDPVGHWPSDHR
jgi:hypothetical protein